MDEVNYTLIMKNLLLFFLKIYVFVLFDSSFQIGPTKGLLPATTSTYDGKGLLM